MRNLVGNRKIKVLVVDDSLLFREMLSKALSNDPAMIVETAEDAFAARDKLIEFKPDVMTCDVEMPKMNGIDFIRGLLPEYEVPVIVISSVNEAVFDAMAVGAVDFLSKPDFQASKNNEAFFDEIIRKVRIANQSKVLPSDRLKVYSSNQLDIQMDSVDVIGVGASTGGPEAVYNYLKDMPKSMPGTIIVQHIPKAFSRMFADRLDRQTHFNVKLAETGDVIEDGYVYVAPGDLQLRIVKKNNKNTIECYSGEKVSGHRPSADVLFESMAKEVGKNAIGIVLTGMGRDGAEGLLQMKEQGALTIGQDEASSVVYGMPRAAYDRGAVQKQGSISDIQQYVISALNSSKT